jgi:hypothetical protein
VPIATASDLRRTARGSESEAADDDGVQLDRDRVRLVLVQGGGNCPSIAPPRPVLVGAASEALLEDRDLARHEPARYVRW